MLSQCFALKISLKLESIIFLNNLNRLPPMNWAGLFICPQIGILVILPNHLKALREKIMEPVWKIMEHVAKSWQMEQKNIGKSLEEASAQQFRCRPPAPSWRRCAAVPVQPSTGRPSPAPGQRRRPPEMVETCGMGIYHQQTRYSLVYNSSNDYDDQQ